MAIAAAMLERPKDLDRIARYVTAASNAYYKAINELLKQQKLRALAEEHQAMLQAYAEANGFVSKSPLPGPADRGAGTLASSVGTPPDALAAINTRTPAYDRTA
jgi:hypothetical protein